MSSYVRRLFKIAKATAVDRCLSVACEKLQPCCGPVVGDRHLKKAHFVVSEACQRDALRSRTVCGHEKQIRVGTHDALFDEIDLSHGGYLILLFVRSGGTAGAIRRSSSHGGTRKLEIRRRAASFRRWNVLVLRSRVTCLLFSVRSF
jgi:hypothetical protein